MSSQHAQLVSICFNYFQVFSKLLFSLNKLVFLLILVDFHLWAIRDQNKAFIPYQGGGGQRARSGPVGAGPLLGILV